MIIKSVRLAKFAMNLFPGNVKLGKKDFTRSYLKSLDIKEIPRLEKEKLMIDGVQKIINYEKKYPFKRFFDLNLKDILMKKTVLYIGCYNGGRSIVWFNEFKLKKIYGIDIKSGYIEAAKFVSREKGINARYCVGYAENLPFENERFNAIISYDVFEHVKSVDLTLSECYRVLVGGGYLIAVFPPFFNPSESHMGNVTRTWALQWFFNNKTLARAYAEIAEKSSNPKMRLEPCERLFTLNGITVRKFFDIIKKKEWEIYHLHLPLWPITTRFFIRHNFLKKLYGLFGFLTKIPLLQELVTDRICIVLRKPNV